MTDLGRMGPPDPAPAGVAQDGARLRATLSLVLAAGVGLSAVLLGAALVAGLLFGWDAALLGGPPGPTPAATDFSRILEGLAAGRPIALAQLGLLVLLATPVLRVATSVVAFAMERDRLYVAISAGVLAILLASILVIR